MSLNNTQEKLREAQAVEKFIKFHRYTSAAYVMAKVFLSLDETWRDERFNINMLDLLQLDRDNYNNLMTLVDYIWERRGVRTSYLFEAESMQLMREIVAD